MNKLDMTETIMLAKAHMGVTWEAAAKSVGVSPVWLASACIGMNSASFTLNRKFLPYKPWRSYLVSVNWVSSYFSLHWRPSVRAVCEFY